MAPFVAYDFEKAAFSARGVGTQTACQAVYDREKGRNRRFEGGTCTTESSILTAEDVTIGKENAVVGSFQDCIFLIFF